MIITGVMCIVPFSYMTYCRIDTSRIVTTSMEQYHGTIWYFLEEFKLYQITTT